MSIKTSSIRRKCADSFRTNFLGLLDYISTIFPNHPDIVESKKKFEMAYMVDSSLIIKSWYTYVYSIYYVFINEGNIRFFLEKDYRADLQGVTNADDFIDFIERVRVPLQSLSDEELEIATDMIKELNYSSYYFKFPEEHS